MLCHLRNYLMKKKFISLAFLIALAPIAIFSATPSHVEEIKSVADYENLVTRSTSPVVIDFYANWCLPCKKMIPIFDRLSAEFEDKVRFVKINVDNPAMSDIVNKQFKIRSIPTFIFKKGQSSSQRFGSMTEAQLRTLIEGLLN